MIDHNLIEIARRDFTRLFCANTRARKRARRICDELSTMHARIDELARTVAKALAGPDAEPDERFRLYKLLTGTDADGHQEDAFWREDAYVAEDLRALALDPRYAIEPCHPRETTEHPRRPGDAQD